MTNQSSRLRTALASLLCGAVLILPGRTDEGLEDQRRAAQTWKERRDRTRSLKYSLTGKCLVPKGLFTGEEEVVGEAPEKDYWFEQRTSGVLDFESSRYRREYRGEDFFIRAGKFIPEWSITAFDGKTFKTALPREGEEDKLDVRDLILGSTDLTQYSGLLCPVDELPVLFACGITRKRTNPRQLRETEDFTRFNVQGYGIHNERRCLILRSPLEDRRERKGEMEEFWIDVGRSNAVVKWMAYTDGHLRHVTEIEPQQTPTGWIPAKWKSSRYDYRSVRPSSNTKQTARNQHTSARLYSFCSWEVQEWVVNPEVDRTTFSLTPTPGMIVQDNEKGNGGYYVAEENGALTPVAFDEDGRTPRRVVFWVPWRIGVAITSCVLLVVVIMLAFRQVGKRSRARK